jgi:hypothetical protein
VSLNLGVILVRRQFEVDRENSVRARAFAVHGGGGHLPVLEAAENELDGVRVADEGLLGDALDVDAALAVFADGVGPDLFVELNKRCFTRSMICSL